MAKVRFTTDEIPMPEMSEKGVAAFIGEELPEWFLYICCEVENGRKVNPQILLDLSSIARAIGEFLRTGKPPKTQDWPKESLPYLAKTVSELCSSGDEDGYAWLFALNLERAVGKLSGCEAGDA